MDKHYYQVVRKDELQHGLSFQKLGRKTAKYIAKNKKGLKTRYIYTQKELEAYKRALSSKDELSNQQKARADLKKAKQNLSTANKYTKSAVKLHGLKKPDGIPNYKEAKKQYDNAKRKEIDATNNLERAKTLKGKAEAVRDTYRKLNPKQAKAIDDGKKKVDKFIKDTKTKAKTKANAYGKALSSKDEKKAWDKAIEEYRMAMANTSDAHDTFNSAKVKRLIAKSDKDVYDNSKKGKKDERLAKLGLPKSAAGKNVDEMVNEANENYKRAFSQKTNANLDMVRKGNAIDQARSDYNRSLTLKSKAEDVRDTYRQFHPKKKKKKS